MNIWTYFNWDVLMELGLNQGNKYGSYGINVLPQHLIKIFRDHVSGINFFQFKTAMYIFLDGMYLKCNNIGYNGL